MLSHGRAILHFDLLRLLFQFRREIGYLEPAKLREKLTLEDFQRFDKKFEEEVATTVRAYL